MEKQKVILITGGSSRLGQIIVNRLSSEKYIVYSGQRTGGDISLDVTDEKSCVSAIERIVKKHKTLDIVVNVAGVTLSGPLMNATTSEFQQLLDVNVIGHFRLNTVAARQMVSQGSGHIMNITSLSGRVPLPGFGIYSASKSAAESLGEVLHYELQESGVRVTNIIPGAINFGVDTGKSIKHRTVREKIPILKFLLPMATPESIAQKVALLVKSQRNPIRIIIGFDARVIISLYRFLPISVFGKIVQYLWQKK